MKTIYKKVKLFTYAFSIFFLLNSCVFSFSKEDDKPDTIAEKLVTEENGLECSEVIISNRKGPLESSEIIYGERILFQFEDMKGFVAEDSIVYPGIKIIILDKNKDTVLTSNDLYATDTIGIHLDRMNLSTNATLADPIRSNNEYNIQTHIWDKKGTGSFKASFNISLVPDASIKIKNDGFSYGEICIFSDKRGILTSDEVVINEDIHFVIEGLEGYQINNGKTSIGGSLEVRNSFGLKIFDEQNLFQGEADAADVKKSVAPYIFFDRKDEEGPIKIKCKVKVWDKKSDRSITLTKTLTMVDELEW